jgi:hypothetical protein
MSLALIGDVLDQHGRVVLAAAADSLNIDPTTSLALLATFVASVATPFLAAWINQPQWSKLNKQLVVAGVSAVIAAVTVWLQDGFDTTQWVGTASLVFAAALGLYHGFFKNAASALESATRLGAGSSTGAP